MPGSTAHFNGKLVLVLIVLTWGQLQGDSYVGDVVIRVEIPTQEYHQKLDHVLTGMLPTETYDVWRHADDLQRSADVYVTSGFVGQAKKGLKDAGLHYFILNSRIDDLVRLQRDRKRRHANANIRPGGAIVGKYERYSTIVSWTREMALSNPHLAKLHYIGDTHEGRPMHVLQIGRRLFKQKAIWLDAGLHAREWIAPASAIYLAHKLLTEYESDSVVRHLVDNLHWFILIVANPDGYEYTFTKYRFWRKNRRPAKKSCMGVDLNRNWSYMWGGADASPRPCSVIYRGPEPESEPEVKNIVNFLLPRKESVLIYLSLHSYGQKFLGRWAYTNSTTPSNHANLMAVADHVVESMSQVHGRQYSTGTAAAVMYPFSGGSADWAHGVAGIRYSYVVELRDEGVYGFLLPEEEIVPTAQELWVGMEELALYVIGEHGMNSTLNTTGATIRTMSHSPSHSGTVRRNYWREVYKTWDSMATVVSQMTNYSQSPFQEGYRELYDVSSALTSSPAPPSALHERSRSRSLYATFHLPWSGGLFVVYFTQINMHSLIL